MSRFHTRHAWHKASRRAKLEAGFRCQFEGCGRAGPRLMTHHVRPLWRGGTDDASNLVVLCARHHKDAHRRLGAPPHGGVEDVQEPRPSRPRQGVSEGWKALLRGL